MKKCIITPKQLAQISNFTYLKLKIKMMIFIILNKFCSLYTININVHIKKKSINRVGIIINSNIT